MISAREALGRLQEGNRRFVSDDSTGDRLASRTRRIEVATGQEPFAIVLGCSDSRVPAEIVFDQGLGDLFVIRVAGNIVASSQVGSVEFAAEQFGTPLVVVLGHSKCGAILATLEQLSRPREDQSRNLRSIVDRIRPSVEPLLATELKSDPAALLRQAGSSQCPRVREPSPARIGAHRAPDPEKWAPRGRCGVFARDRGRRVLRWRPGGPLT
jgi:carbonic anhydrase